MYKKKRNVIIAILEQLLPVILAVVCILVMTLNTNQSVLPVPRQLNFAGEYSFDGGESWTALTPSSDLSTENGDLMLRGHFDYDLPKGCIVYFYRNHFGIKTQINGEPGFMTIQSQLLVMGDAGKKYFADTCGREWSLFSFPNGLQQTDTIEIHLQKMHDHIDRNAFRDLLDFCYMGSSDTTIVEAYLQPHATLWNSFGILLIIVAVMMLGATAAAAVLQTRMVRDLSKLGFLMLFSGAYMLLDTIISPFWSETLVFNTYGRQISMMLTVYWMGLIVRDMMTGARRKLSAAVMGVSLAVNIVVVLPAFLEGWSIYDMVPLWMVAQVVFSLALLIAAVWELLRGPGKVKLNLYSGILVFVALLLDIVGVGSNFYTHGICTKIVFVVLFVIHGFRALKMVLVDHLGASRAKKQEKELEDSRIAIMLSQMQPHFVHNILNVIYYICGKDPAAAQEAISKFSDHLRNNLEALDQKELITFRKELDHIHTYLELEQIRFEEELSVVYDIEEESFLLPVLTIQPLVENAVKHGIAKKRGGGVVTISSRQTDDAYLVVITDTGVGFDVERYADDGKVHVGLANVRQRLASRMNATVDIVSEQGSGTTVTVTIPKEKVPK